MSLFLNVRARMRSGTADTFAAMRHPNYRIWSAGQFISAMGGWMQNTAQGYLIYDLTQSTTYLGLVSFAWGVPIWLFTLYGGVVADRVARRTLLLVTNSVMLSLSLCVSILIFAGVIQPWHILVMAFCSGVTNAFDGPSRNGFVMDLVGREDLTNAIALNATIFHLATILGPAMGGLAYAALGPGWCFATNATAFAAMLFALWRLRIPPHVPRVRTASAFAELSEGIRYSMQNLTIRTLLINLALFAMFGFSLMTLLPAWAVDVLGGDVRTNGLLLSARGVGSLIAALMVASLGRRGVRGRLLTMGTFILPLATLVFAQLRWVPASLALLAFMGWGMLVWGNVSNALLQTEAPDELRGRIMGLFVLILFGFQPLGALLVGSLAAQIGAPASATIFGAIVLLTALVTWLRAPFLRRLS
jgi:MFS family permease